MPTRKLCFMLLAPLVLQSFVAAVHSAPAHKVPAIAKTTKKAELPKVYDFYTSYCAPCKVIKPIFEAVESEYRGKIDMERIDAEDPKNKALVDKYKAETFPWIVFVDSNGKNVEQFRGKITKKELVDRVNKLIAK